ncbi:MAG: AAA-like domain-containing protein [Cyanobacteria bacterium SID2]|nr:AAA-like domain-containing protein [Cyanobacteria bacterium SID2]
MNLNQLIEVAEHQVLSRSLSPIERFILSQSWDGRTYNEIARVSGYDNVYVKQVGSQLWQGLSDGLGEKVTKKNLHLVFGQFDTDSETDRGCFALSLPPDIANVPIEMPSGPLTTDSPLYVERPPIENLVYKEVEQPGCAICIKAPRKMGKSSLLNRLFDRVSELGYRTVSIDFQEADASTMSSLDRLLRWFCANVSRLLEVPPRLDEYWDSDMGSKVSCKLYFEGYLLPELDRPCVLVLNEVHRLFDYPEIALDFLAMLRFWHEQARVVERWQNLRLVTVYTTEMYVPLKLDRSPFNVGLCVCLPVFNRVQVRELAWRYGLRWEDDEANARSLDRLMAMVGGHPYLVNVALYHLSQDNLSLDTLLKTAPTQGGIYSQYLRERLATLRGDVNLSQALYSVVTASDSVELEATTAYKLESLGAIRLEGNRALPSCQLDRLYFREQLADENNHQNGHK